MTKTERERYREELTQLAQRLTGELRPLREEALQSSGGEASGNLSNAPMHLADLGTDTFEQEMALCLLENKSEKMQEITEAIRRLDEGTFGTCENCEKAIGKERLRALPFTRYCVRCAAQIDSEDAVRV